MLPVIFLIGSTCSGKGTLGSRLAADFNFHHLSFGDTFRAMDKALRGPIPDMPENINKYITKRKEIPESVLAQFKPGYVPVILQLHNRIMRNSKEPNLGAELLRQKINELMSRGGTLPRAVIVDGWHSSFSGSSGKLRQVLNDFAPSFSGLTIYIRCPMKDARIRYLKRARPGDVGVEAFEKRMRRFTAFTPPLLSMLGSEGVIVETVNDDTMSIDEAYHTLLLNLEGVSLWRFLCGMPRKGEGFLDNPK
ncbi:hypothetical protein F4859DRAFT_515589 [Xylaria cf. heliscus]|nr:hypothetical protein F4859DRAFT_515589 [Xylaria cf. heliscus]